MKSSTRMNKAPADYTDEHRLFSMRRNTDYFEHEPHEFHELFRADDTSIHMQVTVATATENL